MVSLITLAPDTVAAILDGALPNHITLFDMAVDPQALWGKQRERVGLPRWKSTRVCRRPRTTCLPAG